VPERQDFSMGRGSWKKEGHSARRYQPAMDNARYSCIASYALSAWVKLFYATSLCTHCMGAECYFLDSGIFAHFTVLLLDAVSLPSGQESWAVTMYCNMRMYVSGDSASGDVSRHSDGKQEE
jgi:hypothetical protein